MYIIIQCDLCNNENFIGIDHLKGYKKINAKCDYCGEKLVNLIIPEGYIYILSNPNIQNLVKIGRTNRNVEERVNEFNAATSTPSPFNIEAYFLSENTNEHESKIHKKLNEYRLPSKEFFEVDLETAISETEMIIGRKPVYVSDLMKKEYDQRKRMQRIDPGTYKSLRVLKIRNAPLIKSSVIGKINIFMQFHVLEVMPDEDNYIWGKLGDDQWVPLFRAGKYYAEKTHN